jgi:excisionase family DNA binding protein
MRNAFEIKSPLLTKKEVADLLRVSTRTVENLTNRGILPKITLGTKMVRYPEAGIKRLLEESTTNTTQR